MRFQWMTPHQFESVREYVDTLVVSAFTPTPVDVAVPFAASEWIGAYVMNGVSERVRGRVTTLNAGASTQPCFLSREWLAGIHTIWIHPVRYTLIITDRSLVGETAIFPHENGHCILFDWWQWLRARVPEHRLCDAWMYLCHACPTYWESPERAMLGMEDAISNSMREEGAKLLDAMVSAAVDCLMQTWNEQTPMDCDSFMTN